jgi:FkbM family methyltransferase
MSPLAVLFKQHQIQSELLLMIIGGRLVEGEEETTWMDELFASHTDARQLCFEPDEEYCQELNSSGPARRTFYPVAIAKETAERDFYITQSPYCSSLYPPDDRFYRWYHGLDGIRLNHVEHIPVVGLEEFCRTESIDVIHLLHMDVQGAELEILEGATDILSRILCVHCEVEFAPIYREQPLFSDILSFMTSHGFQFSTFTSMAKVTCKPSQIHAPRSISGAMLWGDALFVPDFDRMAAMEPMDLLRLAAVCENIRTDFTVAALARFDEKTGESYLPEFARYCNRFLGKKILLPEKTTVPRTS